MHCTAPANNGAAITAYVVTPFVGGVARHRDVPIGGDDTDDHRPDLENRILVPRCRGEQPRHRSELHGVERGQLP